MPDCPCSLRQQDEFGNSWPTDDWCHNEARTIASADGRHRYDFWCEDCINKVCQWCRHD